MLSKFHRLCLICCFWTDALSLPIATMSDDRNDGLHSKVVVLLPGADSAAIVVTIYHLLGAAAATGLDITDQSHSHMWMNQQETAPRAQRPIIPKHLVLILGKILARGWTWSKVLKEMIEIAEEKNYRTMRLFCCIICRRFSNSSFPSYFLYLKLFLH